MSQKDSSPTPGAFRQFLKWLDEGVESNGQKYLEMRRRLVYYFERKNCLSPDDLADETLSRVARRLAEEGEIRDVTPAHYCYMVARFVFLEYQRHPASRQVSIQALPLLEDAAGMLPDHPKYPEVRRLKDRAFEALLRARTVYWDHVTEHKCRRPISPTDLAYENN